VIVTETTAAYMLELAQTGNPISAIAAVTGVPPQTVSGIISGSLCRHMLPDVPRRTPAGDWQLLTPTAREIEHVDVCCDMNITTAQAAEHLGVSVSYSRAVRRGEYLAWVLPNVPRRSASEALRTCCSCRFYSGQAGRPCDLQLPDATGVLAARNCGSYLE
jgi:hypothetical protein